MIAFFVFQMFQAFPQISFAPGQGNLRYPVPQEGAK